MRILVVEDENQIAMPLIKSLKAKSYAVDYAEDGKKAYSMASVNDYDCILLDLNLPEMDGIEVAKKLRKDGRNTPILMLTARVGQKNIWEGFENGTDDYLTKPFDLKELFYRVEALVKRNSKNKNIELKAGDLIVNTEAFEVKKGENIICLNNKEFGILEYLIRNKGKVVTSEDLLEHVWDNEIDLFTQTLRTHMKTLRKKIDPEKKLILTIRGKGYVIR
jgi:two-component system, OmpR family, response regulator